MITMTVDIGSFFAGLVIGALLVLVIYSMTA